MKFLVALSTLLVSVGGCTAEFQCNDKQELCDLSDTLVDEFGDDFVDEFGDDLVEDLSDDFIDDLDVEPFVCDDDSEIPATARCDGEDDCSDGEDERGCGRRNDERE